MHPIRKRRLCQLLGCLVFCGGVTSLVLYAMRQNISLFYTPTQILQGQAPEHHLIRVGGMVEKGSVQYRAGHQVVLFKITDFKQSLQIRYRGLLPDLFREGQGVVVNGQWEGGKRFRATEVLAKHDATYMAPPLRKMLEKRESHAA